ncbi:endoglin isoform X1 [Aptenodytes patagonicus]|uniref:endoglin isoform X1 n=1 Tax=Aptenodytes patagonicus TaxID=9234 RepID=UPI003FA0AEA7
MGPRAAPLLPLLLALLGRPDPGRAEGCDLQPVTAEPPITLSYATSTVPRGCVSSGSVGTSHEVHILSIEWSKASAFPLKVSVTPRAGGCTRSAVLVLLCARCSATVTSPCPDLLIRTDARLSPGTTAALDPELPMATSEGQLLAWAQDIYGGITSYSELRDPRWVQVRLGEDASSPPECIPQERFDAMLHLETEVFFHGVKGCSRGDTQSTRAAHIVRLQPEPSFPITEVNLSLSCPERAMSNQILILQSQANLTWSLSVNNCHIQFLVSGSYKIAPISSLLLPGELLPDTEQGLVAKAFEKNYSIIASYSAIPASTRISLEIQEHEAVRRVPATPTPPAPTANSLPHVLLLMLQPWKCTDETMEIVIARSHLEPIKDVVNITLRDISCQAEKNATHFMLKTPLNHCGTSLEGKGHANNELILNLAKGAALQSVRVAFQCKIPRELFLRLFPTAAFEVPQTELEVNKEAFVQASMRWEDHPADLQLKECWLAAPGREPVLLMQGGEARGAGVAVLEGPPSSHGRKVWRFRFTYAIPEGGRVPFSATLKCKAGLQNTTIFEKVLEVTVKDSWRPPNNRGLGLAAVLGITFGAFLIGALLTAGLWYIYSHTPRRRPRRAAAPTTALAAPRAPLAPPAAWPDLPLGPPKPAQPPADGLGDPPRLH